MENNQVKVINPEEAPGKGRPTMYKSVYTQVAYKLALLGSTNKELAESFGVSLTTFKTWLKQHPDFLTAVKAGKDFADGEVAHGLFKRATGYEYQSEKLITVSKGDGISEVERHSITIHVPPDPGAALNWLKNRVPDKWRDKIDIGLPPVIELTMNLNGDGPMPPNQ